MRDAIAAAAAAAAEAAAALLLPPVRCRLPWNDERNCQGVSRKRSGTRTRGWAHTETAAVAPPRFLGSASTLLGVSPVSSLTRLDTLLSSSAAALHDPASATRRRRPGERAAGAPLLRKLHLLALALERGVPAREAPRVSHASHVVFRSVWARTSGS